MTMIRIRFAAILVFSIAASAETLSLGSQPKLDLPSRTSIEARMLDYIDSTHEPAGQTFRAELVTPVKVDGQVVISSGSRLIVKMVMIEGSAERPQLMLDLIGVQLGKRWARIERLPDTGSSKPAVVTTMEVSLPARMDASTDKIVLRGERIFVPSKTVLSFVPKEAVRLQPEK